MFGNDGWNVFVFDLLGYGFLVRFDGNVMIEMLVCWVSECIDVVFEVY